MRMWGSETAYMYHSLCYGWNICYYDGVCSKTHPQEHQSLYGQPTAREVEYGGGIRLGQQLEKDRLSQRQYDLRKKQAKKERDTGESSHLSSQTAYPSGTVWPNTPQVFCGRSKGNHSSYTCSNFNQQKKHKSPFLPPTAQSQAQQSVSLYRHKLTLSKCFWCNRKSVCGSFSFPILHSCL